MRIRPSSLDSPARRGRVSPNEALIAAVVLATATASVSAQPQFLDVTATHMVTRNQSTTDLKLGDIDSDGDADLIICHGPQLNRLHLNDGSGTFSEPSWRLPGSAEPTAAVALGDVDGDGDLDLAFANVGQNRLYVNDGTGRFSDVTASNMPPDNDQTSSVAIGDVDGDGDLDLVFGCMYYGRPSGWPNRLYLNDGAGRFVDATATRLPMPNQEFTNATELGDVDADGDLDLIFGNGWYSYGLSGQTTLT